METGTTRRLSRRQMLRGAALLFGTIPGAMILEACGTSSPAAPAAATTKPAAPTAPAAAAATTAPATAATSATKPVTAGQQVIIRDHDWIQGTPGAQGDWYDAFIAKFEDAHPDIKITREWIPRAEMHAKQLALAATGQIGDTVRINLAPLTAELQLKNVVRELNSLYASDQQWVNNDLKQFWKGNLATYTRDGKLYGLPVVGHPGAVQYYVNTTMVQKLGLKMPPADGNWTLRRHADPGEGSDQERGRPNDRVRRHPPGQRHHDQ